jgi:tetratricopeptide (TPR) repeat protein
MVGTSYGESTFIQVAGNQYTIHLPPDPPGPARCTLPADTAAFTGRARELAAITTAVAEAGRVVAIHALDGMPGVGKTALAVHVGHRLVDRFPDRQLFVDLHAHTAGWRPTDPADALASLLVADGMDARFLPEGLEERAGLWRNRMAHKQVLLILDNAAGSDQVLPLLPGSAGCLVLVTSRRSLGDLPAVVPVSLDVLPAEDAYKMFVRLAPRAAGDSAGVDEVVGLCGRLPLAISLLAQVFSQHRSWTLEHLVGETRTRLLTVVAENRTVAATFDLSYEYLPAERQQFFRCLGLHPGVDIDPLAAAALAGVPLEQAREQLEALYRDRLLEQPVYRRYRMHDLIRDYARALAAADPIREREAAVGRVVAFYQHTAARAEVCLTLYPRLTAASSAAAVGLGKVAGWGSQVQAWGWLRAERANLLACLDYATRQAQHTRVVGLTAGLVSLLRADGPWPHAAALHTQAAAAARRLGDGLAEATILTDLAEVRRLAGDSVTATELLEQAQDLFRDLGHHLGEANALYILGTVRWAAGDYAGAGGVLEQALRLYRDLGNQLGEATTLTALGDLLRMTGYPGDAARMLKQAGNLYHDLGQQRGEAIALTYLGVVRWETGDLAGAAGLLDQARSLHHSLGHQVDEATASTYLGAVRWLTGEYSSAAELLEGASGLYRELGYQLGEAQALIYLGAVRRETDDCPDAARLLEQALSLYRNLGNRHGEANACTELAAVHYRTEDYSGATRLLDQALDLYRAMGNPLGEAEALNHRGALHLKTGHPDQAHTDYHHALQLARSVNSPLEEARALHGTGRCVLAHGDTPTALTHLRQALQIYQRLGAAEATQLTTQLAELEAER